MALINNKLIGFPESSEEIKLSENKQKMPRKFEAFFYFNFLRCVAFNSN